MTELADLGIAELLDLYRRGKASPVEAVESCLARIDVLEPRINAVVTLCADSARACASEAERRWRSANARALEGIPFGLKDNIATAGVLTTGGSPVYRDHIPSENATVAQRLLDAGAILMAKLQTTELASGSMQFGDTLNPWGLKHMSGGSSAGSAAALAARELPLTIGTDTGGSIRNPSAFCGICGLKPTYGRVSRHGVMTLSFTLDTVGPMARSAGDVALALAAVAGWDELDPTSSEAPVPDYFAEMNAELTGVRVGIPTNWFFDVCSPEVAAATRSACAQLERQGAELVEIGLPVLDSVDFATVHRNITAPESAALQMANLDRIGEFSARFAANIVYGQFVAAVDYIDALRTRHLLQRDLEAAFAKVDVLITPGSASTAPRLSDELADLGGESRPWLEVAARTTTVFSLAGVPAFCIPSGLDRRGLPMSIQLVGSPFGETRVLQVAHAYQGSTDHHKLTPSVAISA